MTHPASALKADSKEGIEALFAGARALGLVLSQYHERIAVKHGVSTDGVRISRPIPVAGTTRTTLKRERRK